MVASVVRHPTGSEHDSVLASWDDCFRRALHRTQRTHCDQTKLSVVGACDTGACLRRPIYRCFSYGIPRDAVRPSVKVLDLISGVGFPAAIGHRTITRRCSESLVSGLAIPPVGIRRFVNARCNKFKGTHATDFSSVEEGMEDILDGRGPDQSFLDGSRPRCKFDRSIFVVPRGVDLPNIETGGSFWVIGIQIPESIRVESEFVALF